LLRQDSVELSTT